MSGLGPQEEPMDFRLDFHRYPAPMGPLSIALVPWDSLLFGFPVHEMRFADDSERSAGPVAEWLSGVDPSSACLVCAKVDQAAVSLAVALAAHGFYPVETVLELEGSVGGVSPEEGSSGSPAHLRPAVEADLPALRSIAGSAFWSDRFHLDPNLSDEAADRRYVGWVDEAWKAGEPLFAYMREDDGAVIGFYHIRPVSSDAADLMLMALDPSVIGLGLGTRLYRSGLGECARMGLTNATTRVSACNLASLNIFLRLGFTVRSARTALHRFEPACG
jgi:RimJ/RimL family protein N-acetyltransferase